MCAAPPLPDNHNNNTTILFLFSIRVQLFAAIAFYQCCISYLYLTPTPPPVLGRVRYRPGPWTPSGRVIRVRAESSPGAMRTQVYYVPMCS